MYREPDYPDAEKKTNKMFTLSEEGHVTLRIGIVILCLTFLIALMSTQCASREELQAEVITCIQQCGSASNVHYFPSAGYRGTDNSRPCTCNSSR